MSRACKSIELSLLLLLLAGGLAPAQGSTGLDRVPVHFVDNQGLYPDEVAFFVGGADKTIFFSPDGITYRIRGADRGWTVKLYFVDANPDVRPHGKDPRPAVFSYFRGRPEAWRTGLRSFGQVVYPELWPGIDLVFRGDVDCLKYEFHVRPGADPARIRLRYRGVTGLEVTGTESLRIETPIGGFEDASPVAWQDIAGVRTKVEMAFAPESASSEPFTFGFQVGDFDPAHILVLDPAVVVYCGYIGGSHYDEGQDIKVDATGHAYVAGHAISDQVTFPVKVGPHLVHSGWHDAFVAKVAPDGKSLIYCGYIGGISPDRCYGIAIDSKGAAYITGKTSSTKTFPVKNGPSLTFAGSSDAFVSKIAPDGKSLVYSGYLGGSQGEIGNAIAVDAAGHAYIAGFTSSNEQSFPVKVGPTLKHSGSSDGFVCKVAADGKSLIYCGYIGGTALERCTGIDIDPAGNAYVCGFTNSNEQSFPVKGGPDTTFNGQYLHDAFVAKVNATGSALVYCGYIGGPSSDNAGGIAVNAVGEAYIAGSTNNKETAFPVIVGPDLTYNGGFYDAYICKVATDGKSLVYCGYVGGKQHDYAVDVALDAAGNAYIAGQTASKETDAFPLKVGPDLTYNGGTYDDFVCKIDPAGKRLIYCGYIGGDNWDDIYGIAVDRSGNAYVTGKTRSTEQTLPVVNGPDLTFNGLEDGWVAKIGLTLIEGDAVTVKPGGTVTFTLTATEDPGLPYQVGSSFGPGPLKIDYRQIGLTYDMLLWTSLSGNHPNIFRGYSRILSPQGIGHAAIDVPNTPHVIGLPVHTAFVTLHQAWPSGIKSISNTWKFKITP